MLALFTVVTCAIALGGLFISFKQRDELEKLRERFLLECQEHRTLAAHVSELSPLIYQLRENQKGFAKSRRKRTLKEALGTFGAAHE